MIEAAKLENASNWTIFRRIIIPMTSSTAIYVFTITVVFGLQYVLVPVNMLTQEDRIRAVQFGIYRLSVWFYFLPNR